MQASDARNIGKGNGGGGARLIQLLSTCNIGHRQENGINTQDTMNTFSNLF